MDENAKKKARAFLEKAKNAAITVAKEPSTWVGIGLILYYSHGYHRGYKVGLEEGNKAGEIIGARTMCHYFVDTLNGYRMPDEFVRDVGAGRVKFVKLR